MHVLVVGGTGMLRPVTLWLADQGHTVSLVARNPERVGRTAGMNFLAVDYQNYAALTAALHDAVARHGPVRLAVCWVNRTIAPGATATVAGELARSGAPFRLLQVRGSPMAHPTHPAQPGLDLVPPGCDCQLVILGWMEEGGRTRWLTDAEIAAGVIRAIESGDSRIVVGVVRPWHHRPTY